MCLDIFLLVKKNLPYMIYRTRFVSYLFASEESWLEEQKEPSISMTGLSL